MKIWRRKMKELYSLDIGEKLKKCPEDAKLEMGLLLDGLLSLLFTGWVLRYFV